MMSDFEKETKRPKLIKNLEQQKAEKEQERIKLAQETAKIDQRLAALKSSHPTEIENAIGLLKSGVFTLNEILKEYFPDLLGSLAFWWAFLEAKDEFLLLWEVDVLVDNKPAAIINDKVLMLGLCSYDARSYYAIPSGHQLKSDEKIVEATLESNPFVVWRLPGTVQLKYPHLVGAALARLPLWEERACAHYREKLDPGVWNIREIVVGWANGGGDLHNLIPGNLRQNEDVFVAFNGHKRATRSILGLPLPDHLKSNKDFMTKLLEQNPLYLHHVGDRLVGDFDLCVAALSAEDGILACFKPPDRWIPDGEESPVLRWRRLIFQIANHVRAKLHLHNVFVKLILGSIDSSTDNESVLSVLDQAEETSVAIKQLIAGYAGVPIGKEVGRLRRARKTLTLDGFHWPDPKV